MIEWVPIKDFKAEEGTRYLIYYENPNGSICIADREYFPNMDRTTYGCAKVTHAARINFPKEKTLVEKFGDYFSSRGGMLTKNCKELAQIAKEHYEGEK